MNHRKRASIRAAIGVALVFAVGGCATAAGPSSASSAAGISASGGATADDAAAYCVDQGGMVVHRVATWNTNADKSAWLRLTGALDLCEFETGTGAETTRISVDLNTLYSEAPTLAAVAYLSKVKPPTPPQVGMNPGAYDCSAGLAGSGDFGTTASGGGWVNEDEPVFTVMNLCVFPDLSAIDEFGIFYFADDAVRGADLTSKFRYQPGDQLPAIFDPRPGGLP